MGKDYKIDGLLSGSRGEMILGEGRGGVQVLVQFLSHVVNFLLPAVAMALLVPSLARLVWWKSLASAGWWRQVKLAAAVNLVVLVLGLLVLGRDGAMWTYAGLVLASALAVWWTGLR
ncbi:hypothetical protein [Aquabacterium sp. UBA2148]|uniref:hypothetical protein n=1 Tax=Aquabacterium sp. UBA2148 TaxID=1946042 RepID=UPI00257C663D|nr:hypothetical protein [Aquabacterium sp. UBA2148]